MLPAPDHPESDFQLSRRSATLLLGLLTVSQAILFYGSFRFFFQGDSLYWLAERYKGWADLGAGLLAVDSYGYFRPLSHALPGALLHPLFGLDPTGYHAVALGLVILTSWLLHSFLLSLSGNRCIALPGTAFFALHSTHVFVTFDLAFAPELLYGLCYLLSVRLLLARERVGLQTRRAASCLCFALSLLCKEAAVTLPANLFLVALFMRREASWRKRAVSSLRFVAPHLAVLAAYLAYLGVFVRGGAQLLGSASGPAGWVGKVETAAGNLGLALLWGFNLPGAWSGAWRSLPAALEYFLIALGLAVLAGLVGAIVRPDRRRSLIPLGFVWFVIALSPTLTLTEFKPYYLYVPLFGLSLAVGRTVLSLRERVPRRFGAWGDFALVLSMAMLWQSSHLIVRQDLRNHPLLGPAAEDARQAGELVAMMQPRPSTILILDDPAEPLWWRYAQGGLFELVCDDPSMQVLFASLGARPSAAALDDPSFRALQKRSAGLVDVTRRFRERPADFLEDEFVLSGTVANLIQVDPGEVTAGADRYVLRLPAWADREVEIQVRREGGPTGTFRARLDAAGAVSFFVSSATPAGRYEFPAARTMEGGWIRSDPPASLLVKP